ncbi:hypothetical protein C8R47DRAFT_1037549, partial [Mycena vitilis]
MDQDNTLVEGLWFSDGFLVIKAEEKCFRVPRAILSARSTVFASMLEQEPPQNCETVLNDGTPVIVLHDSAKEVEVFLRAIYDSSFFMPPPKRVDRRDLIGILRMSHKYGVDYLFRRALLHLSEFDRRSDEYRVRIYSNHFDIFDAGDVPDFDLIIALHEVGAYWLLPLVYYTACRNGPEGLHTALAKGADEDLVRICLHGCQRLSDSTPDVHDFLHHSSDIEDNCLDPWQCSSVIAHWWSSHR